MKPIATIALWLSLSIVLTAQTLSPQYSLECVVYGEPETNHTFTYFFPRFDPSLGELTAVHVIYTSRGGGSGEVEITNAPTSVLSGGFVSAASPPIFLQLLQTASVEHLSRFGSFGVNVNGTVSNVDEYVDSAYETVYEGLGGVVGDGNFTFDVELASKLILLEGAGYMVSWESYYGLRITIQYEYTPWE